VTGFLSKYGRTPWAQVVWIFALFTGLALLCAVQEYVAYSIKMNPIPWSLALRRSIEQWYLWAALTAPVLWLATRFPFEPGQLRRSLLVHAAAAGVVTLTVSALHAALLHGQTSIEGAVFRFPDVLRKLLWLGGIMNLSIYTLIVLVHHGWRFYRRYQQRERQAAALATELVQARLDALRMQLNPHFLFNTLHAIAALIHEDPPAADRMVVRLSELLRQTLDHAGEQEVPLRQELALLDRYLEIERARFQDRLSVRVAVEPGLEEVRVPFLILQPLVENAIRHGIEPREDMGHIDIAARRVDDQLELSVADDGPGLPEPPPPPAREGIGWANTRSRLAHLYGPHHRFELVCPPSGGLAARLLLPCRTQAGQPDRRVVIMTCTPEGCTTLEPGVPTHRPAEA